MRLGVFALAAVIVSNLAAYARRQAVTRVCARRWRRSLSLRRQLAGAASLREVWIAALPRLTAMLRAPVLIVLPDDGSWRSIRRVNGRNRRPARLPRRGADWHGICSCQSWLQKDPTTGADASAPVSHVGCWFQCGQVRGRLG